MNNNWIFLAYYVYAAIVVVMFSYAVFWLNHSGWWFLVAFFMLPETTSKR